MIHRFKFKIGDKVEVSVDDSRYRGRVIACEYCETWDNGKRLRVNKYLVIYGIYANRHIENELRRVKR